jgi:hypothetical protein
MVYQNHVIINANGKSDNAQVHPTSDTVKTLPPQDDEPICIIYVSLYKISFFFNRCIDILHENIVFMIQKKKLKSDGDVKCIRGHELNNANFVQSVA